MREMARQCHVVSTRVLGERVIESLYETGFNEVDSHIYTKID